MGNKGKNDNIANQQLDYKEYKQAKRKQRQLEIEEKENYKRVARRKRHYKKLKKKARLRPLKNFLWWFCGFCSFVVILAGSVFGTLYFVKVKDILGENSSKYVSNDIANKTLLNAGLGYASYTLGDIPAIKVLVDSISETVGLNNYIEIDLDKLNNKKLISSDIVGSLTDCINVVATLSSTGAVDYLGDFGNLDIMKNYDSVPVESLPDESGIDFNCELYYYKKDDDTYARAFDDNYKRVSGAEEKELYYPALQDIGVLGLGNIMLDRLETEKAKNLLSTFGIEQDSSFFDIVGDKTIKEMQTFDINELELDNILPVEDNKDLFEMLLSINEKEYETGEEFNELAKSLKIGELSGLDTNNLQLTTVLNVEGNEKLYDILLDMTPDCTTYEDIRLADLSSGEVDNIRLLSVLPLGDSENPTKNAQLYSIIEDMTGQERNEITVGSLNGVDVEHIKLLNVLPMGDSENPNKNAKLYDVLRDLSYDNVITQLCHDNGWERYQAVEYYNGLPPEVKNELITVASLDGGNINAIKLKTVITLDDENPNKILKKLLSKEGATVGDIETELNNLTLAKVFEVQVFTTDEDKKINFKDEKNVMYKEENGTYTIAPDGEYYISKEASVWLLMLYDCDSTDIYGFGEVYNKNTENTTISQMDSLVIDMTTKVKTATIRQLVSCGLLDDAENFSNFYNYSLQGVLEAMTFIPST